MHFDLTTLLVAAVAVVSLAMLVIWHKSGSSFDVQRCDELLQSAHKEIALGNFVNAESLLERAATLFEQDPATRDFTKQSSCIVHLADCYARQGKFKESRDTYQRLLDFWRKQIDRGDDSTLMDIDYFVATNDFGSGTADIADLYKNVVDLKRQRFGPNHTEVVNSMLLYSKLLAKLGEKEKAEQIESEAKDLQGQQSQS